VQYATGFRDGYSNGRAAGLHLTDRGPDLFNVPEDVDVEKIKNYELGFKGVFFDRRLSLTGAVFYMDYTDLQVYGGSVLDIADEPAFNINAGEAAIRGFELEATVRPFTGVELHVGVDHVDSEIKEVRFTDEDVLKGRGHAHRTSLDRERQRRL
jgi:outer membrane receptor protein involved in Fe transport